MNTKYIDITYPLDESTIFYSHLEGFKTQWVKRISHGDDCNMSAFSVDSHVGTHVDAPLHYVKDGKAVNDIPLSRFFTKAQVLSVPHTADLDFVKGHADTSCRAFLFRFGTERLEQPEAYFSVEAIQWLYGQGAQIIGTDNYGVDSKDTHHQIHLTILPLGMSILEVLNLKDVRDGVYDLIALSMKVEHAEAAPARVLLLEQGGISRLFDE